MVAIDPSKGTSEYGPSIKCVEEKIPNQVVIINAVSCTGEGGPVFSALLKGRGVEMLVESEPADYYYALHKKEPASLEDWKKEVRTLLSTFKFIK